MIRYDREVPLHHVVGLDDTIIGPLRRCGITLVGDLVDAMPDIQQGEVRGIGDKRYAVLVDWVGEFTA